MASDSELVQMFRLSTPLILAELGWMAMGVVDTMFVGRVSPEAMGAVGLGTTVFYGFAVSAGGPLYGLDTFVSRSHGAGNREEHRRYFKTGLWLAALLIPIVMLSVWAFEPLLPWFGADPVILRTMWPYLRALIWSAPPLLIYFALRRYIQALHLARPVMITLITANLVNLFGNWVLVLGNLGAPRMGAEGSGWSTCISRVYMAAALAIVLVRHDVFAIRGSWRPDWRRMWALLKLGAPSAGQMAVEIGVFATVTVMVSKFSAIVLAGHQVALTTVSTTFMMPLGVSSAAAVRVGYALGRSDPQGAGRAGWTALGFGAAIMSCAALCLLVFPAWIARWFTPDIEVIRAATTLLRIAAFFQLFDGVQGVITGTLRGLGNTSTAMKVNLIAHWLLGLPTSYVLCFVIGWGVYGLWVGLSLGLIVTAIILLWVWSVEIRDYRNQGKLPTLATS